MKALAHAIPGALAELLRSAPLSHGKVTFAWKAAVGPAIERVTSVRLESGTLLVDATGPQWALNQTLRPRWLPLPDCSGPGGQWDHRARSLTEERIVVSKQCRAASTMIASSESRAARVLKTGGGGPATNKKMRSAVILSAVRTPTGKFLGALKTLTAPQLGALVVAEAVRRAGIDPAIIDECIMGNVVSAGLGQNPARQAALGGGLPDRVAALTINMVCGSGLRAVMLAAQSVATGDIDVAVAGGMESMSNCPYFPSPRARTADGHAELVDSMIQDGLWCAFEQWHMGNAGEVVAEEYHVSRQAQDAFAARSHEKARTATDAGWFADELPDRGSAAKGPPVVDRDEPITPTRRWTRWRRSSPRSRKTGP